MSTGRDESLMNMGNKIKASLTPKYRRHKVKLYVEQQIRTNKVEE